MNLPNFFAELKRRRVYRVAIGYAIAAWLAVQIASTVLPTFHVPEWVLQTLIVLVALGFPAALVLAWAFDITPAGIEKTADRTPTSAALNRRNGWLLATSGLAIAAVAIAGYWMWHPWRATPQTSSSTASVALDTTAPEHRAIPQKSIAVLPFGNLSHDQDNAYFAEGIQDEILTRLAKIADLKVISRTSTQRYKSSPDNLPQIAKQLGVANILEGSVQKAGDQVRVNVQLINAQTDSHLWADTYDRKLTDIFGVESEIAKSIAESLQAKLTGREEQALAVKPTNNPEAYEAYLRGLALEARSLYSVYPLEQAIGFYEQAVRLDATFALAWSSLARVEVFWYSGADTSATRGEAAKRALDHAQKLQPNSPETLLALGYYQVVVLRDYGLAKTTFELVTKMLPGSSEAQVALGQIARGQGHWDESIAYFERALVLDPRNTHSLGFAADIYLMLRRFPAALKLYDRALDILPNDPDLMASKTVVYQAEGNLEEAAKFLSEVNAQTPGYVAFDVKMTQLRLERHHDEAVRLLQARLAQFHFGSALLPTQLGPAEIEKGYYQVVLAFAQRLAGDSAGAKLTAEQARGALEPACKNQPNRIWLAVYLSRAYAALGDKNSALKEAQRIALLPGAKDAHNEPGLEENLALIQMIFGENSRAISTLARLLETPYGSYVYSAPVTPALLRLDPLWDPLRADPAFQKLCEEKKP